MIYHFFKCSRVVSKVLKLSKWRIKVGEIYCKFLYKDFSEIWVKCLGGFISIYRELWGLLTIESKVYKSSFQRAKPFVYTTSELRDIHVLMRLRKKAPQVGPSSSKSIWLYLYQSPSFFHHSKLK